MEEKKKILILEDEQDLADMLRMRLEDSGYHVVVAHDGQEGLIRLYRFTPDIIILDINMPKMSGIEFYKQISTEQGRSKYPVLVLTARGEMRDLFEQINADGFMEKPFEINELLDNIRRIILGCTKPVLYIVDIEGNLNVKEVKKSLEKERYNVLVADGLDGFKAKYAIRKPDYIFVEYMQKNISGEKMIREIKKIISGSPKVPIIVYFYSGLDYSEKSIESGADKFIGKPRDHSEFIAAAKSFHLDKNN